MKKFAYSLVICLVILSLFPGGIFAEEQLKIKVGPSLGPGQKAWIQSDSTLSSDQESYGQGVQVTNNQGSGEINGRQVQYLKTSGSYISYNKTKYRSYLTFVPEGSRLHIVNVISLDDYIRGVLPREMSTGVPLEALKAQAVASRGFALSNKNKFIKKGYNLDDTTSSQVYSGLSVEAKDTNRAVDETRGEIPYYKGNVASTIFHATSGGYTIAAKDVWGGNNLPYLEAIKDPYSEKTRNATWEYKISWDTMKKKMESSYPGLGNFQSLKIQRRNENRRVMEMEVIFQKGSKIISGEDFRRLFGTTKIKSTWFFLDQGGSGPTSFTVMTKDGPKEVTQLTTVDQKVLKEAQVIRKDNQIETISSSFQVSQGKDFLVKGRGYGHGVGMSQYGAMEMAKKGKNYREILQYYYPQVTIGR